MATRIWKEIAMNRAHHLRLISRFAATVAVLLNRARMVRKLRTTAQSQVMCTDS
jgi:hypothetical protein